MNIKRKKTKRLSKRKNRRSWPTSYRWMAVGTLAAYTTFGGGKPALAYAQIGNSPSRTPEGVAAQLPLRRFDIPAGPLDAALNAFQISTGIQMDFMISKESVSHLNSPGISGLYTVEQALGLLLANSDLSYRISGSGAILLGIFSSESVSVTDSAEMIALGRYQQPLLDTPQAVTVVSHEVMQDQGVTTLRDALRNVSGISLAAGEGGAQGDNLTIRGFTARNDIFLDGMRDFGSYYRDPFNQRQVEVLQGPSSVTFGRGSTGGVVNQESKSPTLQPSFTGTAQFGTDHTRRITLDLNKPLPQLGPGDSFRLNLMANDSGIAGRDAAENRRFGVAPSLVFGLGTPTRITLDYFHFQEDDTPDYGVPWFFHTPAVVPHRNYYGFEGANFLRTSPDVGTAKIEHDMSDNVTIGSRARCGRYPRNLQITEPQIHDTLSGSPVTPTTPFEQIMVTRNEITANSVESYLWNDTSITARVSTGLFKHSIVTGIEGGRETSDPVRTTFTGVPLTPLLGPNPQQPFAGTGKISSQTEVTSKSIGVYFLDSVSLGKKFLLTGGARWDYFDTHYQQSVAPASAFHRMDDRPSWRGALVYKPASYGSMYFAYGTSFNPSAESLSLTAGTANLSPEENETYEAGTKWEFLSGGISLAGSIFRTEKMNARETSPVNSALVVLAGDQRVDGATVQASGHLTDRWKLLGSYSYLDG